MKKIYYLLFSILLIFALFLSGCVTFTVTTKINPNGSGKRIIDVAIDENLITLLEAQAKKEGQISLEEQLKKDLPQEANFKKYSQEGKVHYESSFNFSDIEELKKINEKMGEDKKSPQPKSSNIKLIQKNFLFFSNYTFLESFPSLKKATPEEKRLAQVFSVVYNLTLPGKLTKANTSEVKEGTATWRINPIEGGKVEASSVYVRWWAIILIAVIVLVILFALFGAVVSLFIIKRRRETQSSEELAT